MDVTVSCGDTGLMCDNGDDADHACTIEFLTELGDVPLISASTTNVDSVVITESQVS